jgi:hypothetical protein
MERALEQTQKLFIFDVYLWSEHTGNYKKNQIIRAPLLPHSKSLTNSAKVPRAPTEQLKKGTLLI